MKLVIGSQIKIMDYDRDVLMWCRENLLIANPEYAKKQRMGFWTGNTPKTLQMYESDGGILVLPFGCLRSILPLVGGADIHKTFHKAEKVDYGVKVPLRDYQQDALLGLLLAHYGILQSPAGSGKTQIGIALACALGVKTLWLTHTKDLLNQSRKRALQYMSEDLTGTITEGKVNIGKGITFATIQTMCKLDLDKYKDTWDCIIVDECHRVSGTPTAVTRFSKVLNRLRARHKYGLSATVHRADGLIRSTYAILGEVVHTVSDEAVAANIIHAAVQPVRTGVKLSLEFLNSDGTINYSKMITYLTKHEGRNLLIVDDLIANQDHSCLILSERVEHLMTMYEQLGVLKPYAAVIDGKMVSKKQKAERAQALDDMRSGKKRYLFATYSLAKEGLDIPRLDRLFLTTPQKDYAVIVQSVGRVNRAFEGKERPIVYDYVDSFKMSIRSFKKRCTSYRKCNCVILEEE